MIEISSDPDVDDLVCCDAAGCAAWEYITDSGMPAGWVAVAHARPEVNGSPVVDPLSVYCSAVCAVEGIGYAASTG